MPKICIKEHKVKIELEKSYKKEIYRKLLHLSSLWIPALIYFAPRPLSLSVFSLLLFGDSLLEYGHYKRWKWARKSFGLLFCHILRKKETKRSFFQISGSFYVLIAAIACLLLFGKIIAMIAMTVMLVSDTLAALVGRAVVSKKIYKDKSLAGTAAFLGSAIVVNLLYAPLFPFSVAGLAACVVATFAEVFEDKIGIDDNLSIPLSVGLLLSLFS